MINVGDCSFPHEGCEVEEVKEETAKLTREAVLAIIIISILAMAATYSYSIILGIPVAAAGIVVASLIMSRND